MEDRTQNTEEKLELQVEDMKLKVENLTLEEPKRRKEVSGAVMTVLQLQLLTLTKRL